MNLNILLRNTFLLQMQFNSEILGDNLLVKDFTQPFLGLS